MAASNEIVKIEYRHFLDSVKGLHTRALGGEVCVVVDINGWERVPAHTEETAKAKEKWTNMQSASESKSLPIHFGNRFPSQPILEPYQNGRSQWTELERGYLGELYADRATLLADNALDIKEEIRWSVSEDYRIAEEERI